MQPRQIFSLLIAGIACVALVVLAGSSQGQPKSSRDTSAASKKSGAEKPATEREAASTGSSDLGEPPPKRVESEDSSTRPSPLNPNANEFPDGGAAAPPAQYDRMLGEIASLRSRVAALTTTLFASKLRVVLEADGSDARIQSLSITLDDGVVFVAPERFMVEDEKIVYEHAVAPGHHVLGVDVERYDVRGGAYRTWQSSKFSVVVPEGKLVEALLRIEDDSDMAEDFPDDQDGEYDLRVRLRARVED